MTAALTSVGVQQISITIGSGAASNTGSITTVGTGAIIAWQGQTTTDATTAISSQATAVLTNTTTVTVTRNTSSTDSITVVVTIVDGDPTNLVKTVQSGTTTIASAATSGTSSISAVTNTNAAIFYLGTSSASVADWSRSIASVKLSGTTVTVTRGNLNGADIVSWCVAEYQGAALTSSTQNVTITSTASGTSFSTTITSVTTANTMLAYGGAVTAQGTSAAKALPRLSLASSTAVHSDYNTAPVVTTNIAQCVVVEFVAGMLAQSVQRNTITITAGTSNTATITSSATAQTLANWLGNSTTETTYDAATAQHKLVQTNATTLTESVNSSATGTGSFEAIQFNPAGGVTTVVYISDWFG